MLHLTPTSFMLYLVRILDMLYVICDTWYWYLPYYTWHVIPDPDICLATLITWHWTLMIDTWRLLLTYGICYIFMWYKYLDLTLWLLTGHYHPWYLIIWHIHDYTITGTWHDYYIIITRYLVLLSSCTPVYLNPWNREAPDITPVLYYCWPRNRIIMDIVHLWTPREHYYLRLCHM